MARETHPAFIGADCASYMSLATRVTWYAIWIKAYPLSAIHFRHLNADGKTVRASFIVEAQSQWSNQ